jgi:translation initiation factor 1
MNTNKSAGKVSVGGGSALGQNPFGSLSDLTLPEAPKGTGSPAQVSAKFATGSGVAKPEKNRGRVDVLREKAGRGGKTVTVAAGFTGIGLPEKEQLAKKMQKACGVGGTVKDGRIEIQGDKRDEVARILVEAGFRPVFSGG